MGVLHEKAERDRCSYVYCVSLSEWWLRAKRQVAKATKVYHVLKNNPDGLWVIGKREI